VRARVVVAKHGKSGKMKGDGEFDNKQMYSIKGKRLCL